MMRARLLLFCCCAFLCVGRAEAAFSKYAQIAISHARAGSADLVNYPMLVSGTFAQLASTGNGGYATSASGYDIVFATDNACTSRLNWETEYWDANGKVAYWVNIPTLSHTSDNMIYLCVGDSSITTDQSNPTAVWNSNYAAVWHFPNGTTLSAADSTSNANNWTGVSESAGTGVIDGDISFGGSQSSTIAENLSLQNQAFTVELWIKYDSLPGAYQGIVGRNPGSPVDWMILINSSNQVGLSLNQNYWSATDYTLTSSSGWVHLVWTYDGSNVINCYANGTLVATRSGGMLSLDGAGWVLGQNATGGQYFTGQLDELRMSNVALPANYVAAVYANESSPNSFYSLNFPIPGAIATGRPIIW